MPKHYLNVADNYQITQNHVQIISTNCTEKFGPFLVSFYFIMLQNNIGKYFFQIFLIHYTPVFQYLPTWYLDSTFIF